MTKGRAVVEIREWVQWLVQVDCSLEAALARIKLAGGVLV
jgi:hypothetical protein